LNVPQEASNDDIYGPAKQGCAGIPQTASEYDNQLIYNAFKLLTSKDAGTQELAYEDLQTTVQKRIGRPTDLGTNMSGNNEGEFRRNTNAISTTWTKARIASTRTEVEWTFENTKPSVSFDGKTLHDKHRRNVLST
jgi:5'-deoxynucleotidase YfbR-like HD superfamily hydrolase